MARKKTNDHLYVGRAGHLASMAECLSRGWNVAIPEVDVGEDILVVEDASSNLAKVQVKTASGRINSNGFQSQFVIPLKQINDTSAKGNDLRYVFVTRLDQQWKPFVVMTRKELQDKVIYENAGTKTKTDELKITLYFRCDKSDGKVIKIECGTPRGVSKSDFTAFQDRWESTFFKTRIVKGN